LTGHGQESLLYIGGALCGGLEEGDAEAVCELLLCVLDMYGGVWGDSSYLCYGVLDHLLVCHIGLVAHQQLVDALGGVSVNFLQPLLHVVERVHVGDIVDDADAVGTAVVRGCDGSEALLTSGIPLWLVSAACRRKLSQRLRHTICSFTVLPSSSMVRIFWLVLAGCRAWPGGCWCTHEVDTDGRDVALCVCVVGKTKQQARLSDTRVSDEQKLEEVIVSVVRERSASAYSEGLGGRGAMGVRRSDSASTRISTSLVIYAMVLLPGLWRWASRGGYVLLRIHVGGRERGVIKVELLNVLLGDTWGYKLRVSRGAGVEGVKYKGRWLSLECFCATLLGGPD
jgi:hypothetical protein